MNRSTLFTSYNLARRLVRAGQLDRGRVNRALGIAQRKGPSTYNTSSSACSCADYFFRKLPCKHMISLALKGE